ncbi:hypothetical protein [Pseudactinotalea terrae]|uniref:hypothetical protein n=1 Tax=Pseudactinotalea terrae TaxID=1743262 RepID=UPI0012E11680|nr:hypothetical protein [Pseudactinotalea terrae]
MTEPAARDPRPEAEIATPPRGVRAPEPPAQVWGSQPRPDQPRRTVLPLARVLWAVALVIGLLGTAWISTDYFRTYWLQSQPREPAAVDANGAATLAGITISLVEARDLGDSPSLGGSEWRPPAGFHAWRVVLRTESTNDDVSACEVALVDDRGREFLANHFVESFADGYEWSYTCRRLSPEDDIGPEQALLVLVPADAEPRSVRITEATLDPGYIELEIG